MATAARRKRGPKTKPAGENGGRRPPTRTASAAGDRGDEHRDRMARRSREQTGAVSEVGEIPACVNPERREAGRLDLHFFLITYFPKSTGISPFSDDHLRAIKRIESALLHGGRFAQACYRGWAKTSILEGAALWAALHGHRRFLPLFGADSTAADISLDAIKDELMDNDMLLEDFPEICHPIRHLEGTPQRCGRQTYKGERTRPEWTAEMIRFPAIPGAAGAEAVIITRGILSGFRGLKVKLTDGTQQRPDAVLLDDIQTDESSRTPLQVGKTLRILRKAIARLSGHRRRLAMVLCGTVIEPDDAVDSILADRAWQGERIPLMRKWPDAHKTLWLESYANLRRTFAADDVDGQQRAHDAATEFYRAHREEMDKGGEVSWASCYDEGEISALQHAYNILIDDGEEAFASECQNQPLRPEDTGIRVLTADEICKKVNQLERGTAPHNAAWLTGFIDVHDELLVWGVCAWAADFTGAVVAYGTYPEQTARSWQLRKASPTLIDVAPAGSGIDGAIRAGLVTLRGRLLDRDWARETGGGLRLALLLVDSGYKDELVYGVCRESAVMRPSKGYGVGARKAPMSEWTRDPAMQIGDHWRVSRLAKKAQLQVQFDSHYWKSFLHARLGLSLGDAGALVLHAGDHRLFAEHLTAERPELIIHHETGRRVQEWGLLPGRTDNHWFDVSVACAVGAAMLGAVLPGQAPKPTQRKTLAQLQAEARARQ